MKYFPIYIVLFFAFILPLQIESQEVIKSRSVVLNVPDVIRVDYPLGHGNRTLALETNGCQSVHFSILTLIGLDLEYCDDFSAQACISILTVDVRCVKGNLKDGIDITVSSFPASGNVRIYLKDNCVRLEYDLHIIFDRNPSGDVQLFCLP